MPTVNIYEAKTQFSKLVDKAASGTDIIIARNGKPVARITTLQETKKLFSPEEREERLKARGMGALQGQGWIADDFDNPLPPEILAEFEGMY
ncbi:type II toxin-antitoxin system Phd/YefM family antitoxin [Terracidiphilus gabretensis]|uniref:type II toxin-antitoxin system Phd/YefM family antitoxin n=1 Tax=Terracidiphilus gabretensis TaxID=1577687 RepID=UPI00071BB48D|nr:type II toxin-antitoxin system prevent-host-death family antitoxin [Terracidiphilus gabretensis]